MAPHHDQPGPDFDFMRSPRQSLQLTAIFARNRPFQYIPRRLGLLLQRLYFVLIFVSTFHITIMLTISLCMAMQSGLQESVYYISHLIIYTLMPFQLVYFQVRAKTCHDLMDHMNRHFLRRSARGEPK